jgi:3-dehydroquinate synthase
MVAEAFIAYRMDMIDESVLFEIRRTILRIYGHHPRYVKPVHNLLALMRSDKKNLGEQLRFALLDDIGSCRYDINVPDVFIEEGLIFYGTILKHNEVMSYAT